MTLPVLPLSVPAACSRRHISKVLQAMPAADVWCLNSALVLAAKAAAAVRNAAVPAIGLLVPLGLNLQLLLWSLLLLQITAAASAARVVALNAGNALSTPPAPEALSRSYLWSLCCCCCCLSCKA
jgi:hypothetical protein